MKTHLVMLAFTVAILAGGLINAKRLQAAAPSPANAPAPAAYCKPFGYGDCAACKDCSACGHCKVRGGVCTVCK